ncbi:alpha/beta hydrolase [Aestuariicoccus sp. MJ-SS9]|uniref:alpha/beta hydrolase n=1 Tax=Aestuariicoccus sp. MJ-SS9 TaxID=3079855 RepID=UPI002912F447|nr:alpha/beta hydrolase [Aestuariicoccus sp. MJ-SS9]MDU8913004.1 alpha/beta hydrolase [Aestuariicoccus sp. MJ-SS9]
MTRRAILLVPSLTRREQLAARDQLVQSLLHYTDGWESSAADSDDSSGMNVTTVTAKGRQGEGEVVLDLYEAYWADLVPDRSGESPWQRFSRGFTLVTYWMTGGLMKALLRGEFPVRTMVAMIIAGLSLIIWYAIVVVVLLKSVAAGDAELPKAITNLTDLLGITGPFTEWAKQINDWPVSVFLAGLLTLGRFEGISNISAFTKAYLRDDPMGEDQMGVRAKARKRVLALLDHVHGRSGDVAYDEVYVVAHSLGGAIAIDALAEYGQRLAGTTLITWGTAIGTLAQREPLIEAEIRKFYTAPTRIRNWVDVVFPNDFMGSKVPIPIEERHGLIERPRLKRIFPDTVSPRIPRGLLFRLSEVHNGYYRSEEAILMLVKPAADLPQPVTDAPADG